MFLSGKVTASANKKQAVKTCFKFSDITHLNKQAVALLRTQHGINYMYHTIHAMPVNGHKIGVLRAIACS